jgi:hypothetical protein
MRRVCGEAAVEAQTAGLRHRTTVRQCQQLDWRWVQLQAATRRPIRLGEYERHLEACTHQRLERHRGKLRRPGKSNAHRRRRVAQAR